MDKFEELLNELGNILGVSLHPDQMHSCTILIDEKMKLQLEMQKNKENLLLGAHICVVEPGRFRENVLGEALKTNNLSYPQVGTLGYSAYNNQLALFDVLSVDEMTGQKLADYLSLFIAKALEWRDAIEAGNTSPLPLTEEEGPKPFGMK